MNTVFKKLMRSGTALLLASSMIAGSITMPVSAAKLADVIETGDDGVVNYVTFGASQTNGYGLRYYFDEEFYEDPMNNMKEDANYYGYEKTPEGAYPYQVAKTIKNLTGHEVEIDQLALSAMRAEEVHMLLDDNYYGDAYTEELFYNESGKGWFSILEEGGLPALRERYQSAVKKADLITVDLGVNNFGFYALGRLTTGAYDADVSKFLTDEQFELYEKLKDKVYRKIAEEMGPQYVNYTKDLEFMAETFAYAGIGLMVNFDAVIEHIYEMNPDVNVVVVGLQNMMNGVEATFDGIDMKLPLGEIFKLLITTSNFYMAKLSPYSGVYDFASKGDDAHVETFFDEIKGYNGDPATLSQNVIDCFNRYDSDLFTDLRVKETLKEMEITDEGVEEKALNASYDILATVMKEAALHDTLNINVMLGGMAEADEAFMKYLQDQITEAIIAIASGEEYEYEFDPALLEDPAFTTAMVMSIRFSLGGRFFAHPNENGHIEIRNAILDALKYETKGSDISIDDLLNDVVLDAFSFEYEVSEDSYYLSIGDGGVSGVGFTSKEGYTTAKGGYQTAIKQTFPYKLAEALELKIGYDTKKKKFTDDTQFMQLGRKDFTPETLRYILDDTYEGDGFAQDVTGKKLETYREDFIKEIKKADLITLGFSNANLTSFVVDQLKAIKPYPVDWSHYFSEEEVPYIEDVVNDMKETIMQSGLDKSMTDMLILAVESFAYTYVSYYFNYAEVVALIQEMNPEAEVLLVGMSNPMKGIELTLDGEAFALGEFIEYLVELANLYSIGYALVSDNVTYVDAVAVETFLDAESSDTEGQVSVIDFMLDFITKGCGKLYPNEIGHEYIKDQILLVKAEPKEDEPEEEQPPVEDDEEDYDYIDPSLQGLLGDVNNDGVIDTSDAQAIFNYFMGMSSEDRTFVKEKADLNQDGAIDTSDAQAAFNIFMGAN